MTAAARYTSAMAMPAFDALPWEGAERLRFGDVSLDFCFVDALI